MKQKSNLKMQCFFRSFAVTAIILFSFVALILGFLEGYARMESNITGKNIELTEIIKQAFNMQ